MTQSRPRRALPPLDEGMLNELALRYVDRFATTRAKLQTYLERKVRERGWSGSQQPDFHSLASRFAQLGYIDDAAYALSKSRALARKGYGKGRVLKMLRVAGVAEDDSLEATEHADQEAVSAALRFAQKRRLGPFAQQQTSDPKQQEKALGVLIRAGHNFGLARAIVLLAPGDFIDPEILADQMRLGAL
jgi:regulatory protein